jgi:hypothetical protein
MSALKSEGGRQSHRLLLAKPLIAVRIQSFLLFDVAGLKEAGRNDRSIRST